jgi:hypothetical protein
VTPRKTQRSGVICIINPLVQWEEHNTQKLTTLSLLKQAKEGGRKEKRRFTLIFGWNMKN